MTDETFEKLHPRAGAGRFTEKTQADPGGTVLTRVRSTHQHEMWQIQEGSTHFFCAACGEHVRVIASATDRNGQPLPPCPVQVEVSYRGERPKRAEFDAATILAGMSLDARRRLLDDDPASLYDTATAQLLTRWTMGDVRVVNEADIRQWVESHRDASLASDGWLETHSDGGWIGIVATGEASWPDAANRALEHVERFTKAGQVAVVVHDGDDFEVNPAADLDAATDLVHRFGFYETGVTHGSYASFTDGNLGNDRSATIYFPR